MLPRVVLVVVLVVGVATAHVHFFKKLLILLLGLVLLYNSSQQFSVSPSKPKLLSLVKRSVQEVSSHSIHLY